MDAPRSIEPAAWAADVVLTDGSTVHVRQMRPDDARALAAFHARQSRDSVYLRFFSPKPVLRAHDLERFTVVDHVDREALVVEDHGEFIAWASYERWAGRDDAEVAFMVDDRAHGKGIATVLLEHLAAIARSHGIERFTAEVLAENRAMLRVFARAGWPVERRYESGMIDLEWGLGDTPEYVESVERREQRGDSRAMARLLLPRSIAVIGASDEPGTIGEAIWRTVSAGFDGPVFAVNHRRDVVGDAPAYRSVLDVVDDVWLAVIAVPAASLASTIEGCIAKRVRGAVVVTSLDGTGIDIADLVAHARRNGLRIVGPASMGFASPRPDVNVQAALVPVRTSGGVAISMQSGMLGRSVLRQAERLGIGISWFVSLGDRADVSGNDLLQFWEDDDATTVIAMYTETLGNPRKFARIARRVSRRRPIVAVRTGAAAIGPATGALYQQAGLIEASTVWAMLDTARVLALQPILRGPRVAVLSNARSPGVLARTALTTAGLQPVDAPEALDWSSGPDDLGAALRAALVSDEVDGVLVVHAPPVADTAARADAAIDDAAKGSSKPVVAVILGRDDGVLRPGSAVPTFTFPEPAAAALGRSHAYARWLETEAAIDADPVGGFDHDAAAHVIDAALRDGERALDVARARDLLLAYRLDAVRSKVCPGADAAAAAVDIGFPVAVKAARRGVGRSARAGVALDLADANAVHAAVAVMVSALGAGAESVVVQEMAPPGVDVHVRCHRDPHVGAVVSVGLAGMPTDALRDAPSRLAPIATAAAAALIEASPAGAALAAAGLAVAALADLVARVSRLIAEQPDLEAVDLDPVIVSGEGAWVIDATVTLARRDRAAAPLRQLGP